VAFSGIASRKENAGTDVKAPQESVETPDKETSSAETPSAGETMSFEDVISQTEAKYPDLKFSENKVTSSDEYGQYCRRYISSSNPNRVYYVYAKTSDGCAQVANAADYAEELAINAVDDEQQTLRDALSYYSIQIANYQSNNANKTPFADLQSGYEFGEEDKFITRYIGSEKYTDLTLKYLGSSDELKGNSLIGASSLAPKSADEADNIIYAITKAECATDDGKYTAIESKAGVALFVLLGDGKIECRNN
jgi:hypothetical protein